MKKIVVFLDSLFEKRIREKISFPEFEIQGYENKYSLCPACGRKYVEERSFIPEKFLPSKDGLVDLIQVCYKSSPKGAHSIEIDNDDIVEKTNGNNGWGSYPNNLYIPVREFYFRKEEFSVIAVKKESCSEMDYKKFICQVSAGNSGTWEIFLSEEIFREEENIEFEKFLHRSCARKIAPSMWFNMTGDNRLLLSPPLDEEKIGSLELYSFRNNGTDDEFVYRNNSFFLGNDIVDKEELFIITTYVNSRKELTAIRCKDGKKFDVLLGDDDKLHYIKDNNEFSELETNYYLYNKKENKVLENLEEV